MIVREASDLPEVLIGTTQLRGRELVSPDDHVGFTFYEVVVAAGSNAQLSTNPTQEYHHVYYFITGAGRIVLPGEHSPVDLEDDLVLALTGEMTAELKAVTSVRFCVLYVKADPDHGLPSQPLLTGKSAIKGSDRDISWGNGHSHRFLLKDDEFNISLTNTVVQANSFSKLAYHNHIELCYYIKGDVTYAWNDLQVSHTFTQQVCEEGKGCVFLLNDHDPHEVRCGDNESITLCVFTPALVGKEVHVLNDAGYSVYQM